jgi:predicted ribosomally synthesized peptide with SipW-like signal peptide
MRSRKAVLGVAALVAAAVLVGVGVFAAFTDTESTNVSIQAGALDITGAEAITINRVAPGDIAFRNLSVGIPASNGAGSLVQSIRLSVPKPAPANDTVGTPPTNAANRTAAAPGSSLLTGAQGLRVALGSCSVPWTLPAAGAALGTDRNNDGLDDSARCTGTLTVTQREIPLANLVDATTFEYRPADFGITPTATTTFPDGSTINIIAQFRLPREADNSYQNAALTFDMLFEAVQRGGVNR